MNSVQSYIRTTEETLERELASFIHARQASTEINWFHEVLMHDTWEQPHHRAFLGAARHLIQTCMKEFPNDDIRITSFIVATKYF